MAATNPARRAVGERSHALTLYCVSRMISELKYAKNSSLACSCAECRSNVERKWREALLSHEQSLAITPASPTLVRWQVVTGAIQRKSVQVRVLTLEYENAEMGHGAPET